ncbi:hypothetical protein [Bacillus atrophaeus]|uniref:hypothetical protein n=1 Tax=Bacillus atrophaeus TaxID=1452 RepID=UPI002E1F0602|nr:hypothetical protein [Bacillus atrophaeus]
MIEVTSSENFNEIIKTVDMNQTLLLTGKAETNRDINKIVYYSTTEAARAAYGDSELTQAFVVAKSIGVPHIFLINVQNVYDYIEVANVLKHYDFAYVAPTNIFLGDAFFDASRNNQKVGFFHHILETMSSYNRSTLVATDNHASLYEDIDAYLDDMLNLTRQFKQGITGKMDGKNICFVANNLKDYPLANVVLASILCAGDLGIYPTYRKLGPAVFNIDSFDVGEQELAYFKNNHLTGTTIENLLNFNSKVEPEKIVTVDRIVKYVRRNLDLSRFKGRQMSAYQKLRIEKALVEYFDPLLNWILRSYEIKSIRFIKETIGSGIVLCDIDIWVINSTEKFSVIVEG